MDATGKPSCSSLFGRLSVGGVFSATTKSADVSNPAAARPASSDSEKSLLLTPVSKASSGSAPTAMVDKSGLY
ncbi:hypothetical protein ACHAXT_008441 [Thalassiosira profunda]